MVRRRSAGENSIKSEGVPADHKDGGPRVRLFSRKARPQTPAPVQPAETPERPAAVARGRGNPPARSIAPSLTEPDMVNLYSVGSIRTIPAGEEVAVETAPAAGCLIVVEGSFDLCLEAHGAILSVGSVEKGEVFASEAIPPNGRLPYVVRARETATVLDLNASAVTALPTASQHALR